MAAAPDTTSMGTPIPSAFRESLDRAVDRARKTLESGEGLSSVMLVGNLTTKETVIVEMDAQDPGSKEAAGMHARKVAESINADFSLTICEAWSVPDRELRNLDHILDEYDTLKKYPKRVEVVMVSLETKYGRWMGSSRLKKLGASHKRRTFGEVTFRFGTDARGRLASIIELDPDAVIAGMQ